ncbi:MAG: ABC transporter permease [Propionibacteriales bacterium]|nr:ABC transporter permease [Propionibacteriales bacterium]
MFRQALSEVRHHPGRFISTLIAIAIAVAFLSGSATLVATEGQAQGKATNVAIAAADIVVTVPSDVEVTGVGDVLAGQPGIAAYAPVLHTSTVVTGGVASQMLGLVSVPPEPLRWARITAGHWPEGPNDIALSASAAQALGAQLNQPLRVAGGEQQVRVVGFTDEPSGFFVKTGYASDALLRSAGATADGATQWAVKVAPGTDVATVIAGLNPKLATLNSAVVAKPGQVVRDAAVAKLAGDFDVFANVLWAFGAVAVVVGMITIANTFSITLAQRRRQIGLLRAVGASGGQVRARFFAEATLLGLVGALLGLALGIGLASGLSAWSTALFWGLALPWWQLAAAVGIGVLATVIAAVVPIVRGTRVMPLEALQPALGADERRSWSVARVLTCGLLLVAGGAVASLSLSIGGSNALLIAIVAGALIASAVLFGGPLFVPSLLRATGALVRRFGPVARLAANNAERNPRRATATATALMLAIGLMVTLQVATASLRATVLDQLEAHFPVDLQIAWGAGGGAPVQTIPAETASKLAGLPGVAHTVQLSAVTAEVGNEGQQILLGYDPQIAAVTGVSAQVADNELWISDYVAENLGKTVTVKGSRGEVTLQVKPSRLAGRGEAVVSSSTLAKVGTPVPHAVMWLSVPDRSKAMDLLVQATDVAGSPDRVSGSMPEAALYEQVLNILLAITTALLAFAVLIALIGVSNTLGLSVLERSRESALLRALGLQSRSLRGMLTIEALQVTIVGVAVGIVAGAFFGWLAVEATAKSGNFDHATFAVDVPQTLGMIAIAMLAAALASVLPGRRAAKAAPTEALADV